MSEHAKEQAALGTALRAALVLFAASLVPAFDLALGSIPLQLFWLPPLTLPFWFAGLAALALARVRQTGLVGGWATTHTLITVVGALLLPLWLTMLHGHHSSVRWVTFVGTVAYVALLPALLRLIAVTTGPARLGRALWLNAVGCLIYGGVLATVVAADGTWPGPAFALGLPALAVIAVAARRFERLVQERTEPPRQILPFAFARQRGRASMASSLSSSPPK